MLSSAHTMRRGNRSAKEKRKKKISVCPRRKEKQHEKSKGQEDIKKYGEGEIS